MLNPPPWWPMDLPVAEGTDEPVVTGSNHTYDFPGAPQRIGDTTKHKIMLPYDIGVWTNGNRGGAMTPGLGQNQVVTYDIDNAPDYWIVKLDSETAGTALVRVYLGPAAAGPFFRLGNSGKLKLPAQGMNYLTLQNLGAGAAFGTVIAVANYEPSELDM